MGIGNVKATFARWYALPDLPFRLLIYMAARSMDDDDPPLYFAGWEELALAGGRIVPGKSDVDGEAAKARRSAEVAVSSATKTLIKRGAVKVISRGAPGRNATYALMLDSATLQADPSVNTAGPSFSVEGDDRWSTAGSADNTAGSPCTTLQDQPAAEEQSNEQKEEQAATRQTTGANEKIAAAVKLIQKITLTDAELATATAIAINDARKPRNLAGLIKHLDDVGELDQWIANTARANHKPSWCGTCDQQTRMVERVINGQTRTIRCGRCHPIETNRT
jgi:hypothetical protein